MTEDLIMKPDTIAVLPDEVSEELHEAIKYFVQKKYLLDKIVADRGICLANHQLHGGGYGPHEPTSFYRLVFPFTPMWNRTGETFNALVPTQLTLGCSWRWRARNMEPAQRDELLAELADPDIVNKGDLERAKYMWIRPLGLVLPNEGKNRVDFFREMEAPHIPARVTPYDYPSSDRLALYNIKVHGKSEHWIVLDGKWVGRLDHPDWVLPVLFAYGVPEHSKWPVEFPRLDLVSTAFSSTTENREFLNDEIVDLDKLAGELAHQAEETVCSVLDVKALQLRKSYWLKWGAASLICLPAIGLLPDTWTVARIVAGIGYGVGFGIAIALMVPGFKVARTLISD